MTEYLEIVLMNASITNYKYSKKMENKERMEKIKTYYNSLRASAEKKKIPGIEKFSINIENMLK